jgi:hypothetical protein
VWTASARRSTRVNQLFTRYRRSKEKTIQTLIGEQKAGKRDFNLEEAWMLKYARAVPIKFIGVFDTVGALGVPFPLLRRIKGSAYPFLNTGLRQNNEYAFHALAIDENRKAFLPTLWTNVGAPQAAPRPIERTEQRWFVGAHANVGGDTSAIRLLSFRLSGSSERLPSWALPPRMNFQWRTTFLPLEYPIHSRRS